MKRQSQTAKNPPLPTERESLAKISESLATIARMLGCGLFDLKGDCALDGIQSALWDIAEYGAGKGPKESYSWRHGKTAAQDE